jgi:hypothetical protein
METLLPMAEQLDRVAVELRLDHPIHNRLAIILIDNAVELMVREAVWVQTALGGDMQGMTAKHFKNAHSRNIAERLSVLVFVGELTSLEAEFIKAAHAHRNAAYHEGADHQAYLRQLAFHYYEFACAYLVRFSKAFYSWSSRFEFTDIGRRYFEGSRESDELMGKIDRTKLATLLLDQLPAPREQSLQDALADDLEDDRQQVASGLRFMIENTPAKTTTSYILAKAQFDWAREDALRKHGLDGTLFDTPRRTEAVRFANANVKNFTPKYRAIPHGSWSQSIRRIRACADPHEAMVLFQKTRRRMEFLGDAIGHAVMRLENELERD